MIKPIIATIDFEASSLTEQGAPIEVGIALWIRGGPIQMWSSLIHVFDDASWSPESADVHGIKREELVRAPHPTKVAELLNTHMAKSPIAFCDGGVSDERWMRQLYHDSSLKPVYQLAPIEAMPGLHIDNIARRMWEFLETTKPPHRAGDDAVRLMRAYAYSVGELPPVARIECSD